MGNLKHWDNLRVVPLTALKTIDFGKLKGKHDINPQWRYEVMTAEFGVCGIGWKYEITKTWTQEVVDGSLMLFVEINLFIKDGESWSVGIPAVGGDFVIEKDKNGIHGNDEAYKMATTDALGAAMKMLGVAADVYRGLSNDTKYGKEPQKPQRNNPNPIINNDAQFKKLFSLAKEKSLSSEDMRGLLIQKYKIDSSAKLTTDQLNYLVSNFDRALSEYIEVVKNNGIK